MDRVRGVLKKYPEFSVFFEKIFFYWSALCCLLLSSMHLCQRFCQSLKQFTNTIFCSFSDALLMSSILVKRRSFKVLFIFGNKEKSYRAISPEVGAWLQCCFWPISHERATTKFSSFGMNFAATRFMPKNLKTSYDMRQLMFQLHQQFLLLWLGDHS
jgi:hypothetical protein